MANQYDDDDDFDAVEEQPQSDNGPAQLRKALKAAEKEKKAMAEELAAIKADLRSRSVSEVLDKKGVPSKVAKFIPSDVSTPEQIDAWLAENADVFGFAAPAETAQADEETQANIRSYQRMNAAVQNAVTPTRDQDVAAKLAADTLTKADLDALTGNATGRRRF